MDSPKYNRTFHVPWSQGATNDDKIATDLSGLIGTNIVITEKMDGSNTSLEYNGCFARTHSGPPNHPSFDGLKALHANIRHLIPQQLQIFGEWCYALHSIAYDTLPGYFLAFNVRELKDDIWLSWEEVEMWADELGVPTVPVLYRGAINNELELQDLTNSLVTKPSSYGDTCEGVVIRVSSSFKNSDFSKNIMKWVRANHVQTDDHWKNKEIVKNKLK